MSSFDSGLSEVVDIQATNSANKQPFPALRMFAAAGALTILAACSDGEERSTGAHEPDNRAEFSATNSLVEAKMSEPEITDPAVETPQTIKPENNVAATAAPSTTGSNTKAVKSRTTRNAPQQASAISAAPAPTASSSPESNIEDTGHGTPDRNLATSQLQELSITPGWSAELEAQNASEIQKARETLNGYAEELKKGSTISMDVLYGWDYEISKATGENVGHQRPLSNAIIVHVNHKMFLGIIDPVFKKNPETGQPEFTGEYTTSLAGNGAEYSIVSEKQHPDQTLDMPYYRGQMHLSVSKAPEAAGYPAGTLLGQAGEFRTIVSKK